MPSRQWCAFPVPCWHYDHAVTPQPGAEHRTACLMRARELEVLFCIHSVKSATRRALQVPFLRSADATAAAAACVATGALAFGDVQAKRRVLESGGCTALVELLLRGTYSHSAPAGASFSSAGCGVDTQWRTAAEVDAEMIKERCGLAGAGAGAAAAGTAGPAAELAAGPEPVGSPRPEEQPFGADTQGAAGAGAAGHACAGTAAGLREAAVLLGAVLDATSASAMQQLSLTLHSRPLAGVAKGVLGATASLVSTLGSGRCPRKGALL